MGLCQTCAVKVIAYNRYQESNIPYEYWDLSINNIIDNVKTSHAFKALADVYMSVVLDFHQSYVSGRSFCLAGSYGAGKTSCVTNILKKATHKNFTALYTTLNDVIVSLTNAPNDEKYAARRELTEVDFLVIDELDGRHIGNSEIAIDLFGRSLEHILRVRLSNKLPIIIVSNSPNPVETFNGTIKESLSSLMSKVPLIPILGADIRKAQAAQ